MYDCSKMIVEYHDQRVRLPEKVQGALRKHRDANEDRVKSGLIKASDPSPLFFVIQGSYDMETIIQQPANDYDIDDGIVFDAEELTGPRGGAMSALEARQMVCSALQYEQFKTPPEVRKNCVRIYYSEGHHVDMPVYRQVSDAFGNTRLELASSDWRQSDPKAVTKWYADAVRSKSPDTTNGRQMRRVTRLLKAFAASRDRMPSGFVLSVLVNEAYSAWNGRDDIAFVRTLERIYTRLQVSLIVQHPVVSEFLSKGNEDPRLVDLRYQIGRALESLKVLYDPACSGKAAVNAWKKVFGSDFFDEYTTAKAVGISSLASSTPAELVDKKGGGRFG
jgi:hypothetical protein